MPTDEMFARVLYTDYAGPLLAVVRRLNGGDRQWAEDVVQETLLRAWQHAGELAQQHRSLMPWLVTVAKRQVINDWRARGVRPREVGDEGLAVVAVPDDTERVLQRMVIAEALAKLRPVHREAVVEVFLRGCTTREAARAIGVPRGTIKSRVFTAIHAIRRRWGCSA